MKAILFILTSICFFSSGLAQPKGYWRETNSPIPSNAGINIVDSALMIAVDTARFFSTSTDGGDSWSVFSSYRLKQRSLLPLSKSLFYQIDSNTIFRSTNSGLNWEQLFAIDKTSEIRGFIMWNASSGFLLYSDTAKHYYDLVTHDGGITFTKLGHDSIFQSANYKGIKMKWIDSLNGLVHPYGSTPNNNILVTHNGGKDWQITHILSVVGDSIVRIAQGYSYGKDNTYNLFDISSRPYFYYSTDYGDHWAISDSLTIPSNIAYPAQSAQNSLWASARQTKTDISPAPRNLLLFTDDFGKQWKADYVTFKDYDIGFLYFTDSLHGFARGFKIGQATSGILSFKFIAERSGVTQDGNIQRTSDFEIYPNPCKDILHLKTSKSFAVLRIINLLGECVLRYNSQIENFDISKLPNGFYTIEGIVKNGSILKNSFLKITP